ncbi:MAG: hypothetical protein AAF442_01845 [Pseudomonadota bacterium]
MIIAPQNLCHGDKNVLPGRAEYRRYGTYTWTPPRGVRVIKATIAAPGGDGTYDFARFIDGGWSTSGANKNLNPKRGRRVQVLMPVNGAVPITVGGWSGSGPHAWFHLYAYRQFPFSGVGEIKVYWPDQESSNRITGRVLSDDRLGGAPGARSYRFNFVNQGQHGWVIIEWGGVIT